MYKFVFIFLLLISCAYSGRSSSRGGGHSYPSSGGYSGSASGGSHSYPSSGGYSGNNYKPSSGGAHSYPSSNGYSGNNYKPSYGSANSYPSPNAYPGNNYKPSSGGAVVYPSSNVYSGNNYKPSSGGTYTYSSSNVNYGKNYGSHSYPPSNTMSGTGVGQTYTSYGNSYTGGQRTQVHHHYHYNPPQRVSFGSSYYPVYHGQPPVYVYEYRNSGSRFDTLLTGLALYNLGRMSTNGRHYSEYRGAPGEICKLGISKPNGEYEEARIDCRLMSSFIMESNVQNTVVNTVSVNGGTVSNTVTVVDALQAKGPSLQVTNGMICNMIRISSDGYVLRKNVDCGLLQEYSRHYRGGSSRLTFGILYLTTILSIFNIFTSFLNNHHAIY